MSVYMYQAVYSKESISNLVKNPQDRTNAINAVVETNGGTLIGCWLAFGEYDLVVIAEMPSDEAMAASSLLLSSDIFFADPAVSAAITICLLSFIILFLHCAIPCSWL